MHISKSITLIASTFMQPGYLANGNARQHSAYRMLQFISGRSLK